MLKIDPRDVRMGISSCQDLHPVSIQLHQSVAFQLDADPVFMSRSPDIQLTATPHRSMLQCDRSVWFGARDSRPSTDRPPACRRYAL